MRADGGHPTRLTRSASEDRIALWSHAVNGIAFSSNRLGAKLDIFVMAPDGSNQQLFISTPGNDYYPTWSPDGAHVVFFSDLSGTRELYIVAGNGKEPRALTVKD